MSNEFAAPAPFMFMPEEHSTEAAVQRHGESDQEVKPVLQKTPLAFKGNGHKKIERAIVKSLGGLPDVHMPQRRPKSILSIASGVVLAIVGPPTAGSASLMVVSEGFKNTGVQTVFNIDVKNKGWASLIPKLELEDSEIIKRMAENEKNQQKDDHKSPQNVLANTGSARTLRSQQKGLKKKPKPIVPGDPPEDIDGAKGISSFVEKYAINATNSVGRG